MLKYLYNYSGLRVLHGIHEAKVMRKKISKESIKSVSQLPINQYKKSDTLFILGSGHSITEITPNEWGYIKNNDSLGFNSWVFHDFTPTYYCMETPIKSKHFKATINEFNLKAEEYKTVPFIIQYQHFLKSPNNYNNLELPKENIYFNAPLMPNTTSDRILNLLLSWWEKNNAKSMSWLMHYSGSLSYLVSMGYVMGYKNIVLLGIDLNDSRYYFHHQDANSSSKLYADIHDETMREMNMEVSNKIHDTANINTTKKYGCLPIDQYLYKFNEILKRSEVNLFIGNKNSKLHEGLPLFKFP